SRPAHRNRGQGEVFELASQRVEATKAPELMNSKQLTTDFEICDFGYDHTSAGTGKRREPLAASQNYRRYAGVGKQSERTGVQQHDGTYQDVPFSSGGNSFRLEVRAASRAWKKS